jgi:hypothetical protein
MPSNSNLSPLSVVFSLRQSREVEHRFCNQGRLAKLYAGILAISDKIAAPGNGPPAHAIVAG